jgi:hypothetical protein
MIRYIITGLPRSRTAWIAQYMTAGGSLCVHELWDVPPLVRGVSDSGAVWSQERLFKEHPQAKWVVIRRDIREVIASMKQCFSQCNGELIENTVRMHQEKLGQCILERSPLVVEFDELNKRAPEIAQFCEPGWIHNDLIHQQLCRINIQLLPQVQQAEAVEAAKTAGQLEPVKPSPLAVRVAEIMQEICGQNEAAKMFWAQLTKISDFYDHVIDDDAPDPKAFVHECFEHMVLDWPLNGFLRQFSHVLVPVMGGAMSAWRSDPTGYRAGDVYSETANAICFLLHGQAGVNRWMPEFRDLIRKMRDEDMKKDGR